MSFALVIALSMSVLFAAPVRADSQRDTSAWVLRHGGRVTLARLKHLRVLRLQGTFVTDAGLKHIAGLADLRELDLNDCRISDAGMQYLKRLTRLEKLRLAGSLVTNAGLEVLWGKPALLTLDLRYTRVTRSGVSRLGTALPGARIAFVDTSSSLAKPAPLPGRGHAGDTEVGDMGLGFLAGLRSLAHLQLDHLQISDTASASRLLRNSPWAATS
jgi:hypothetical protein